MNKKNITFTILLLLLVSCITVDNSKETIKIGAVLSLTGYASEYGENSKKGIELAVNEINKEGGVNGKELQFIFEDDNTDGKKAVTAVQKLIEIDKVDILIGGTWDLSLEPIAPIAEEHNKILINPSLGNTKKNSRLNENTFMVWPAIKYQVEALRPIIKDENIKTAVILRNSGSWAGAQKENFEVLLKSEGAELVRDFAMPEVDNNNMNSEMSIIKELNPDAIYFAGGFSDALTAVKRFDEQDVNAIYLSSESLAFSINKKLVDVNKVNKAFIVDLTPQDEDFKEKFKTKYGESAGITSNTAYKSVYILKEAIEEVGLGTEDLKTHLNSLEFFDENGDAKGPIPLFKVENGQYTKLE